MSDPWKRMANWFKRTFTGDDYDPADNSRKCYAFGLRAEREKRIRWHVEDYEPRDATEQRWWDEGPVPNNMLETVRYG